MKCYLYSSARLEGEHKTISLLSKPRRESRSLKSFLLGVFICWMFSFSAQPASAAEVGIFSFDPEAEILGTPFSEMADKNYGQPFILLKGQIVPGDLERVRAAASELSSRGVEVVLALESPGGSVVEALKIAEFVRDNWITTWIYGRTAKAGDPDRSLIVCDSACAYIFFAGIERRYSGSNMLYYAPDDPHYIAPENRVSNDFSAAMLGAIFGGPIDPESLDRAEAIPPLGLHRAYLDPALNKSLTAAEAEETFRELENLVRAELSKYGVPASLIDRMMKASSDQMIRIGSGELRELMPAYDPWFEEWQLSKCGALSSDEFMDLFSVKNPPPAGWSSGPAFSASYRDFLMEREASIESCRRDLRLERQKQLLD